jgi:hypothetical protein
MKTDKITKKEKLKLWFLAGKKFTVRQLDRLLNVNNSPEIVRQLKKEIPIAMTWITPKNGNRYGRYSLQKSEKVSRIKTRQYMQQA